MKKNLLSLAFGLLSLGLSAQCDLPVDALGNSSGTGNASGVPIAPLSCTLNDGSGQNDLKITQFIIQPNPNYTYNVIVSVPAIDAEGVEQNLIVGASTDGTFNFGNDVATGEPYAPGLYGFTSFVYDQAALDVVTELAKSNPLTAALGFQGGETLNDVITLVRTEPGKSLVEVLNGGPLSVEDFIESILPQVATILGTEPLCVDWATGDQVYNVEVVSDMADCTFTAIEDIVNNKDLGIYPNPASSITNLSFESDTAGDITINLFDLTGKLVQSQIEFVTTGENNIPILIEQLSTGVYLMQINAGTASVTKRLTVTK